MGCFSFMCKECDKPILSNSFTGQDVKLVLLENGEIIQEMQGKYDSYGRVFTDDLQDSIYWSKDWSDVCSLMFSDDESNGIAAIHTDCYISNPTTRSDDDPNQGWGEDYDLFDDCNETNIFD